VKIGVSTYSFYPALQAGEMTVEDIIEWTAEHAGEHVEIVPLGFTLTGYPERIDAIREKAAACGIELSNYAVGAELLQPDEAAYEAEIRRVQAEVDTAARLGVRLMRHDAAMPAGDRSIGRFLADLPRLAEACRRIADYAAPLGITTSVENHGYYLQASDRVQALVQAVNRPHFRTTLDVGNFVCVDEDPLAAVKNNLPYASMVHIKDFYIRPADRDPGRGWFRSASGRYLRGAIAGAGDLPLPEIIHAVKESGYDGFLSLEFEGMEPCRLGVEIGLENVKRLIRA
jgi:sugar phosphate isomerase/epimerase